MCDMPDCFVGFDTSNYTTSAAVTDAQGTVIANLKIPLPVAAGERGLRQSDAVFAHTKNLPLLCEQLREYTKGMRVRAVGVSVTPRDAQDSYMPCFLAGKAAASAYASALPCELFHFSHQSGHIRAAVYASGREAELLHTPFYAFHVSGGTTEVLFVTPETDGFRMELIGGTDDINAGQAIDRVGVRLGFAFPCGKAMEEAAARYEGKIPKAHIHVNGCRCNLSGLENLADKLFCQTGNKELVCAYVLDFVGETLRALTLGAVATHGAHPVLYAGGVMSNQRMRVSLAKGIDACFAQPTYAADNAAGIALLCRDRYLTIH